MPLDVTHPMKNVKGIRHKINDSEMR